MIVSFFHVVQVPLGLLLGEVELSRELLNLPSEEMPSAFQLDYGGHVLCYHLLRKFHMQLRATAHVVPAITWGVSHETNA